jgi:hypothetical protein
MSFTLPKLVTNISHDLGAITLGPPLPRQSFKVALPRTQFDAPTNQLYLWAHSQFPNVSDLTQHSVIPVDPLSRFILNGPVGIEKSHCGAVR